MPSLMWNMSIFIDWIHDFVKKEGRNDEKACQNKNSFEVQLEDVSVRQRYISH